MAVPVRSELMTTLAGLGARKLACWQRGLERLRKELTSLTRALPKDILAAPRQQLDTFAERLPRALRANAQVHHTQYSRIAGRLSPQVLSNTVERRRERYSSLNQRLKASLVANAQAHSARIERAKERVVAFGERSQRATMALLRQHQARVERAERLLNAFSYREVLKRGFALVRDGDGRPLHSAGAVTSRMRLEIEFSDGRVAAVADDEAALSAPAAPRPKPRLRGGEGSSGQGSLFGA
jgi:exodeoxyribonuclease VII large subunit